MTKEARHPEMFSNFSNWMRTPDMLDSKLGFVQTDIDYVWTNYKTNYWIMIEEKCYMQRPDWAQLQLLVTLDKVARNDPYYNGCYLIQFENTSPVDGSFVVSHIIFGEFECNSMEKFLEHIVSRNVPNDRKVFS